MAAAAGDAMPSAAAVANATVVALSIESSFEVVHSRCRRLGWTMAPGRRAALTSIYAGREIADPPGLLRLA
jgi:hypothetical protein